MNQQQRNCSSYCNRSSCHQHCDADSSMHNDSLHDMPLTMSYVPWQKWDCIFNYQEGLTHGTIFPKLALPFYGCIPKNYNYHKGGRI